MRVDAGDANSAYAVVTLDGVRQEACLLADDELGMVVVIARDEHGAYLCDGDELVEATRFGVVRILFPFALAG